MREEERRRVEIPGEGALERVFAEIVEVGETLEGVSRGGLLDETWEKEGEVRRKKERREE